MLSILQHSDLKALIKKIPMLANTTHISELGGGLTNWNYRVDTISGTYVLRIGQPSATLLAINRENERMNTERAYLAGVGPALRYALPPENVMVLDWLEAKTLNAFQIQSQPELLLRIAQSLRLLHAGPKFQGNFQFPSLRSQYLKTVLNAGYFLPDEYLHYEPLVIELEQAMALNPESTVPCHNDLLAENFLDDGKKIWIIDYEFAGQNEPSFELGNLASESSLGFEQIEKLCNAYWQNQLPSKIARALGWSIIARFGWVLWASIQEANSPLDFDFRAWGMRKWNSVLPDLQGDHFHKVLENLKRVNS
jgi:thiamine kinase-like enzyme